MAVQCMLSGSQIGGGGRVRRRGCAGGSPSRMGRGDLQVLAAKRMERRSEGGPTIAHRTQNEIVLTAMLKCIHDESDTEDQKQAVFDKVANLLEKQQKESKALFDADKGKDNFPHCFAFIKVPEDTAFVLHLEYKNAYKCVQHQEAVMTPFYKVLREGDLVEEIGLSMMQKVWMGTRYAYGPAAMPIGPTGEGGLDDAMSPGKQTINTVHRDRIAAERRREFEIALEGRDRGEGGASEEKDGDSEADGDLENEPDKHVGE